MLPLQCAGLGTAGSCPGGSCAAARPGQRPAVPLPARDTGVAVLREQCRRDDAQGPCIPAVPGGWCLCTLQCEAGSATVLAAQRGQRCSVPVRTVPRGPAVLERWQPCSPALPHGPAVVQFLQCRQCPAVLDGRHPWSAPCSCNAGWVAALHSCSVLCPRSDGCCCSCSAGSDGWEGAGCWQCPVSLQCWAHGSPAAVHGPASLHGWQPCSPAVSCVPGWVSALLPYSVPCPCGARWVSVLYPFSVPCPCSARWVSVLLSFSVP